MHENLPIKIYVNEIEKENMFKTKKVYYLDLLMPERMKLLWSTESKITKDKHGENVSHLEYIIYITNIRYLVSVE